MEFCVDRAAVMGDNILCFRMTVKLKFETIRRNQKGRRINKLTSKQLNELQGVNSTNELQMPE
jgi:hypothetical protein